MPANTQPRRDRVAAERRFLVAPSRVMTCTALNFRHRLSRIIPCIRSRTAEASGVPGAIMQAPAMVKYADFLICESTYGDRRHDTAEGKKARRRRQPHDRARRLGYRSVVRRGSCTGADALG